MSQKFVRTSIQLDAQCLDRLDQRCREQGTTRSAIIRDAVAHYLGGNAGSGDQLRRSAMLSEFTQAAVDVLISEQAPDRREDILAAVQERMERYHG